jgi:hypothetical protein
VKTRQKAPVLKISLLISIPPFDVKRHKFLPIQYTLKSLLYCRGGVYPHPGDVIAAFILAGIKPAAPFLWFFVVNDTR